MPAGIGPVAVGIADFRASGQGNRIPVFRRPIRALPPAFSFHSVLLSFPPSPSSSRMRLPPALVLSALCVCAAGAFAASQRADELSIRGIDYVSLNDWGLRHRYGFRLGPTRDAIELVRATSRLTFEKDSN